MRYSFYLKYIRFNREGYDTGKCSILKYLMRPHNYHIISYIKKMMMMLALPLFYNYVYAQISALILIQIIEIVRLSITWPYTSKWRNVVRLVLESVLLALFGVILVLQLVIVYIVSENSTSDVWAQLFFVVGWVGFGLVFAYNLGFLVCFCINWYYNFTKSNR